MEDCLKDTGGIDPKNAYSYIKTFTGKLINPLDASPQDIDIVDIAVALSRQPRWTGHTRFDHYSVAEHSLRVSRLCCPEDTLWGLLHDASEAYICDIARPVKHHPSFAFYREIEKRLMNVICRTFGLQLEQPESVHEADEVLLWTEARDLMGMPCPEGYEPYLLKEPIRPCGSCKRASDRFLERFERLLSRSGHSTPRVHAQADLAV